MARPLRPDPIDGWHHVMNRGVDRMMIFHDDRDRVAFGDLLATACERYGIEVHAYCLMTNHFHLLVRCPNGGLSEMLHDVTGTHARRFNHRHGRVGHLFGDRFASRLVLTPSYIVNAVRYIHRNPLDIAGVESCDRYRSSSHRTYLGHRAQQPWMQIEHVLQWFDDRVDFARFVENERMGSEPEGQLASGAAALAAIDLVVAERSARGGRSLLAQRKALAFGVADHLQNRAIIDALAFDNPHSEAAARWRAGRHFDEHPDDLVMLDRTLSLVAPSAGSIRVAS